MAAKNKSVPVIKNYGYSTSDEMLFSKANAIKEAQHEADGMLEPMIVWEAVGIVYPHNDVSKDIQHLPVLGGGK
jgi:hypothetical protein